MISSQAISIGVGGWAYLPVKQTNKLEICAKIFDFVEVNSSFYKLPTEALARKWRTIVPELFQFSVRANRKLTHENHLEPTKQNFDEYERNLSICKLLRAFVLHFQFPPSFEVSREVVENWRGFFSSLKKEKGMNFAIEIRNKKSSENQTVRSFLDNFDIIPTSDPTRNPLEVSSNSRIQYSRVFGPGEHTKWNFSTKELESLRHIVVQTKASKRYVTFHNITMYEDGARLKELVKQDGKDLTAVFTGIDSLKQAIISEGIKYPISSEELSSKLGWRTVALPDGSRIHVDEVLGNLHESIIFDSLEDIVVKYKPFLPDSSVAR